MVEPSSLRDGHETTEVSLSLYLSALSFLGAHFAETGKTIFAHRGMVGPFSVHSNFPKTVGV